MLGSQKELKNTKLGSQLEQKSTKLGSQQELKKILSLGLCSAKLNLKNQSLSWAKKQSCPLTAESNCAEEWTGFDVFIERLINNSQRNYFERLLVTREYF